MTHELFDGADEVPLADELAGWLAGSRRFRTFAETHRDKIRKKLRGAADGDARRDVRAELRVAHLLLADRRIELAYEALGSARGGPDFTVTFRGEPSFNLEVTRVHRSPVGAKYGWPLMAKLHQLPPGTPNVVLLAIDDDGADVIDVAAATRSLRTRADAKDEAFFASRGFDGTRGFYRRYLRLSAVLSWCERASGDARAALWINRSARIALSGRAARACMLCLRAGQPLSSLR